ncbi:MAG: STAS domain-containing protein [Desulfobacterales bacterium]|nr:STAS domain-containing protein [Desulfobacterales bacterium]
MELISKVEGKAIIVSVVGKSVNGKIDTTNATLFEKKLNENMPQDKNILLLDLSEINFVSSAFLRVILATSKMLNKKKGSLLLVGPQEGVKDVFEISGFSSIFKIFPTVPEALHHIS